MVRERPAALITPCALAVLAGAPLPPTPAVAQPCQPAWSALTGGGASHNVTALAPWSPGGIPALYAAGDFTVAGGLPVSRIARWDGQAWSALGAGLNNQVRALAVFDDGSGEAVLCAGGSFTEAGGAPANRVAKWDGLSWSALGAGHTHTINALAVFNDGTGPALYAGGGFTSPFGGTVSIMARWDGQAWQPLGAGLDNVVNALVVHNDGAGPALYAAGGFTTAGGAPASAIAKWDGLNWSALGAGVGGGVSAMAVFNEGAGAALFVAGNFTTAGAQPAMRIARWKDGQWSALGPGLPAPVFALATYTDPSGPGLYAGGGTASPFGTTLVASRWDPQEMSWTPMGGGVNNVIFSLAVFNDGGGAALYAGGAFTTADSAPAERLARWGCPPTTPPACYANCDDSTQPPVLNVADFGCFLTRYAAAEAYANCDDSTQPPVLNVADFGCFLTKYAAGCQ